MAAVRSISLTVKTALTAVILGLVCLVAVLAVSVANIRQAARDEAVQRGDRASLFMAAEIDRIMTGSRRPSGAVRGFLSDVPEGLGLQAVQVRDKKGRTVLAAPAAGVGEVVSAVSRDCLACHRQATLPARSEPSPQRAMFVDGDRVTVVRSIAARPECFTAFCHATEQGQQVLGTVSVTVARSALAGPWTAALLQGAVEALPAVLLGAAGLAWLASRRLLRPLQTIAARVRAKRDGGSWQSLDRDSCGELFELAGLINDVAESVQKRQHEMDESLSMYQSLFEGVPCLITVQDRDLRLIKYNSLFSDHFGAKPVEHCFKIYKGRDTKCLNCPVEKTFLDGKSHTTEERGFYKDGSPAYWIVRTAPVRNSRGEITAVMEMCLDITERKVLEEKLKKSEKTYATIFDTIPVAVFELNAQTLEVRNCNRKMSQLYGYCKGEVIGKPFANLFAGGQNRILADLRDQKRIAQTTHVDKEGKDFFVSIDISRAQLNGGDILLAVVSDVTDRIRTEQQVIQSSKMATLGEMAAGVAHELNQPLAVLKMVANYFVRKARQGETPEAEELRRMTEKIVNNVDRATKIIEHMREFGRKPNLESSPVLVNAVMQRACDFFSEQLKIRDIVIVWELDHDQPPVLADPNRLEQVFINLLVNARDAIEDKCSVKDCTPGDRIVTMRTRSNARHVVAEVVDTGPGIPRDVVARIFEPFFSTKEVGRGTGLGLSICYDIVTDYDGTIHVFSKPGHGARFVVTLPIAETGRPSSV